MIYDKPAGYRSAVGERFTDRLHKLNRVWVSPEWENYAKNR